MSEATWYTGDALTVMRTLPDASVDLCIFSPPFLALRSYLPEDHPDKQAEMGSEATPGAFVDSLMLIVEECRRVLAPHGSLCVELGDTFAGSGGAGGDYNDGSWREGQPKADGSSKQARTQNEGYTQSISRVSGSRGAPGGSGWPLAKSLTLIPETVRFTMAYGRNPHTGRQTEPWRIRNVIRWVRPNPPVGALGDKFRPATTDMLVACVSPRRFFDLDAVREPFKGGTPNPLLGEKPARVSDETHAKSEGTGARRLQTIVNTHAGAPPLDWWNIPTQGFKGSHYATWPKALVLKPIKAMCPERVCRVCGVPSTRITKSKRFLNGVQVFGDFNKDNRETGMGNVADGGSGSTIHVERTTVGWSDCGHDDWRRGIVLDPFAGSGTTLEVATGLGRDAIGIDLDERNLELARRRVGMFLTEREPTHG